MNHNVPYDVIRWERKLKEMVHDTLHASGCAQMLQVKVNRINRDISAPPSAYSL